MIFLSIFPGSPAYDSVRSLSYQEADVFLVCYKISDPISLYNVKNKWIAEVRRHRPEAPVVLCGCMSDLRTDSATSAALARTGRAPVSREQGLAICCEIGAVNFVEASAATDLKDVQEAFEVCALAAMSKLANSSPLVVTSPMLNLPEAKISKRSSSSHSGHRNAVNDFFSPRNAPSNKSSMSSTSLVDHSNTVSSKKSFGSASTHSSLGKKIGNVSFSGSDSESVCFESSASTTPAQYNLSSNVIMEDDVFPRTHHPKSPRSNDASNERRQNRQNSCRQLRSSFVGSPPVRNEQATASPRPTDRRELNVDLEDVETSVDTLDKQPDPFEDFRRPTRLSSAIVSPNSNRKSIIEISSPLTSPTMAQVRPCGLSRRTSFRSQGNTPKAVATPKSPMADCPTVETSLQQDTLSPLAVSTRKPPPKSQMLVTSSPNSLAAFDMKQNAGESLKSQGSTASQGSTGSKTSTGSSLISTDSNLNSSVSNGRQVSRDIIDPDVPDTEDPELLRQLQFVSPKNGVFRPVNTSSSSFGMGRNGKKKPNCRMM